MTCNGTQRIDFLPFNACHRALPICPNQITNQFNCCDDYDYWIQSFCIYGDNLNIITWIIIVLFLLEIGLSCFIYHKTYDKKIKIMNYNVYDRDDKTYCVITLYILYFIRIQIVFVVISRIGILIHLFQFGDFKSYNYIKNSPAV